MGLFSTEERQMAFMLDEEDFKCLVRGGILQLNSHIKLALQDIGFEKMENSIDSARDGIDIYKGRDRETNDGRGY